MRIPLSTYRVQLNREFRFSEARALVPFLSRLGITDLYVSPIFRARHGSTHGYDVTDPLHLNPELGTEEDFDALVAELQRHDMGLLLDIVPNHMAASPENPWWMDVLENGVTSPYASYFHIEWHPVVARGAREDKVLLPILGRSYGNALEDQEFTLALDEGGFFVSYCGLRLPLDPKSYQSILSFRLDRIEPPPDLREILNALDRLPGRTAMDPQSIARRRREKDTIKRAIWDLYTSDFGVKNFIAETIRIFNGAKGNPRSFDLMDQLLNDQPYRPAYWLLATERINYWRFFDVTDLVGLRAEDENVFRATHGLICHLANAGKISGVRVDHIDGLFDPSGYLQRLRACVPCYVVVEKILLGDEEIPHEWPVAGTTGYDFLNAVNGVFVDPPGLEALDEIYTRFTGSRTSCVETIYEQKKRVIRDLFRGELRVLWNHLAEVAERDRHGRDLSPKELVEALLEVTACLPVYRTYIRSPQVSVRDRAYIDRALAEAARRNPHISSEVFDFLARTLLLEIPPSASAEQHQESLRFVMRWQQFAGPVTAKGVEDTALYVYNRLVSLNEVGAGCTPLSIEEFHHFNCARQRRWPHTLNATSTHDTKRSEDVRARINVLSEIPGAWGRCLARWSRWNRGKKRLIDDRPAPDSNEEMLLYQTLVGAWPLDDQEVGSFKERVKNYMVKATREAKVHTSWIRPDAEHERALQEFIDAILDPSSDNPFYSDLLRFQKIVSYYGALTSLSQLLLKIASPGVPDFYQGTAMWNLSLVDPDNRRPVDQSTPERELERFSASPFADPSALRDLLAHWEDGRIKLFVTCKTLQFRKSYPELFTEGDYLPIHITGGREEHVLSFARRNGPAWVLIVVPRLLARLSSTLHPPLGRRYWGASALALPEGAPEVWRNILTGEIVAGQALPLHAVFGRFPAALLFGERAPAAPSHPPIGDLEYRS